MSGYAVEQGYALEIPGLGVAWRSGTQIESLPDEPEIRDGLTSTGVQIRSSIGLLDAIGRGGGIDVQITQDAAPELHSLGAVQVVDEATQTPVYFVSLPDRYVSAETTELAFSAELSEDTIYLVGTEAIRVIEQVDTVDGAIVYSVDRGVRGSEARDYPGVVETVSPGGTYTIPAGSRYVDSGVGHGAHVLEPVYPDRAPPDLTGWPVRLWRQVGAGDPEVVYRGAIDTVRLADASTRVSVVAEATAVLDQTWRSIEGRMAAGDAEIGRPPQAATISREIGIQGRTTSGEVAWYERRQAIGDDAWTYVAYPRSILPPDLDLEVGSITGDQQQAVRIWSEEIESWYVCAILDEVTEASDLAALDVDPQFWRIFRLTSQLSNTTAIGGLGRVLAAGTEERLDGVPLGLIARTLVDPQDGPVDVIVIRWAPEELLDAISSGNTVNTILPIPQTRVTLLPVPGRDGLRGIGGYEVYDALYGYAERLVEIANFAEDGTEPAWIRAPWSGSTNREIATAELGAVGYGVVAQSDGQIRVIDWSLTGDGGAEIAPDDLASSVDLQIGARGRLSRVSISQGDDEVSITVSLPSQVRRGVTVSRDIDAAYATTQLRGDESTAIGRWLSLLSRYAATVPRASFSARETEARTDLQPGDLVILTAPDVPSPSGGRGITDTHGVVLQRQQALDSRVISYDVHLLGYRYPLIEATWGPSLLVLLDEPITTTGTVSVSTYDPASSGQDRWRIAMLNSGDDPLAGTYLAPDGITAVDIEIDDVRLDECDVRVSSPIVIERGGTIAIGDWDQVAFLARRVQGWIGQGVDWRDT